MTPSLFAGGDALVPEPGGAVGHELRHTRGPLVLRLHIRRTFHAEAALSRPVRGGSAGQDLCGVGHTAGERVAGGFVRVAEQFCLLPAAEFLGDHSGDGSRGQGSTRGMLLKNYIVIIPQYCICVRF
jgi:hypothetical protein